MHDWLGDERNGRWLLILDNLDDAAFLTASYVGGDRQLSNLDGMKSQPLMWCLPHCQHGSVLVTSRSRDAASELVESRSIIAVDPMDKEDASALLRRKLGQYEVGDGTDKLATALECMPLAIVQAAAYILQRWPPCSVQQYLDKFRKSDGKKTGLLSYEGGKLRRDASAKNSILITWQISFDYIHEIRPSAVGILSLMSFCDRQGIPACLLWDQSGEINRQQEQDNMPREGNTGDSDSMRYQWGDGDSNSDDSDDNDSDDEDKDGFKDDIMTLRNFSFISTNKDGKTFEMHRLVQLATLEWLEAHGQQEYWRHRFLRRLCEQLPTGEYENWGECRALFPHAKSTAAVVPKGKESLQDWATVLYKAAWYAWRIGNGVEAEEMAIRAMRVRKKVLGGEQDDTLDAMAMVALVRKLRGRWQEAEKLFVQVMETRKTKLGADHPDTLTSMAYLASTFRNQGRWADAELLNVQVLHARKTNLGADHPDTMASMANLALTYWSQGRWSEAEKLQVQVMKTRKIKHGADHPFTLTSMHDLALTYRNQGRWSEAELLNMQVMEIRKTKLGVNHPDTLTSMANLAITYRHQGRWLEAEKLQTQVMETRKIRLGLGHPSTLMSMANLALTNNDQGRWSEAELLNTQVIETCKTKLGADHPDTLTSIANLALMYRIQGRWEVAEKLGAQVMETLQTKFGAHHPTTLTAMNNLALVWKCMGRHDDALRLLRACFDMRQRKLGTQHPDTESTLLALNEWQSSEQSDVA
jgi:tetratricopeptide (TPR) repeat protein